MTPANALKLNALALYAIAAVLLAAFYFQFALGELPCPLCLLQRVAFTALAVGPVLTLRHGPRPGHYGLIILAGLLGGPSPRGRCFCISCRATPATARRCSATTFTRGRFSALWRR